MDNEEKCPVIHRVTDEVSDNNEIKVVGKCPVDHNKKEEIKENIQIEGEEEVEEEDSEDEELSKIGKTPSVTEYKKLKKVMSSITSFYANGSSKKKANYDFVKDALERLEIDLNMVNDQLKVLDNPLYKGHPKLKTFMNDLNEEKDSLESKREILKHKLENYKDLYKWSKKINEVCQWLESNLADYVSDKIPELKGKIRYNKMPPLTKEQIKIYSKGLDEIKHNLEESRDFFQAAVDGRLQKFHEIEKRIINAQLEVLKKYDEENPRRVYIEQELTKDLEYVSNNSKDEPQTKERRTKMLVLHKNYLHVLKYHTDKLNVLNDIQENEKTYDPKFSYDVGITKGQVVSLDTESK
eukprot:TRINITY_DN3681_c0_g1_i1.p1 TRINITY_DN3681_c0_g1~~TRINITY_DN3681_c0_g1_i1.p1  ORF type:complete len:353 (-),score=128.24 TRINITY_DN3681_c0_g1_i1:118-1176(-)